MNNKLIPALLLLAGLAGALQAAGGGVETKDGKTQEAYSIDKETISGIEWSKARNQPGTKVDIWDLENVRYSVSGMDEYNGLARKFSGGRGGKLKTDAASYLAGPKPAGLNDDEWTRVQLACQFYVAAGTAMDGDFAGAIGKYTEYLKAAEAKALDSGIRAKFKSVVGGKEVTNAGGLHRLYLDGMVGLALAYLGNKEATKANETAIKPLLDLCSSLAGPSGKKEFYDWSLRAVRALAQYSEGAKEYKSAREAYDILARTALQKENGRVSRASNEAQLKVGYMQILEGDTGGARAKFFEATRAWEDQYGKVDAAAPPRTNWINPDTAYFTAGCYVGQGLIDAAKAKTTSDWASALSNFSQALAVFRSDDEVRSKALLGAALAASKLAELTKGNVDTASTYAKLAEKYLTELTSQLPKTKAAEDDSLAAIETRIKTYKKDE